MNEWLGESCAETYCVKENSPATTSKMYRWSRQSSSSFVSILLVFSIWVSGLRRSQEVYSSFRNYTSARSSSDLTRGRTSGIISSSRNAGNVRYPCVFIPFRYHLTVTHHVRHRIAMHRSRSLTPALEKFCPRDSSDELWHSWNSHVGKFTWRE